MTRCADACDFRDILKDLKPEFLEVTISDLARGGSGVARDESGRVIFVPRTAPGDRVRVRVTEQKKNYASAELVEILEPSPIRVTPPCPIFGKCGGCEWQHLPYDLQWKTKFKGALHALSRVGIEALSSPDELPAERIWEYRNRVQLRGLGENLGFFAAGSQELVAAPKCWISRPEINAAWDQTREEGKRFDQQYKVEVEVLPDGGIRKSWNARHGAAGFRQVHDEQNLKLQQWVVSALTPRRALYDLFGGAGNLSLGLAPRMKEVHCVDLSSPFPAPQGTPANFKYYRSGVVPWLIRESSRAAKKLPQASAILDPPREGLADGFADISKSLEKLGITELVAVGCDPDAWARDLSRFQKKGWKVERIAILDLFPQTHHVESLALLRHAFYA